VEEIHGTLYDVVFKKSPKGNMIVTKKPDMSKVKWSQAQENHRQRLARASKYAKAAMADPQVRLIYEERAALEGKLPRYVAQSDYFQGKDLLSKNAPEQGLVGSENPDEILVREACPNDAGSIVRLIQQPADGLRQPDHGGLCLLLSEKPRLPSPAGRAPGAGGRIA